MRPGCPAEGLLSVSSWRSPWVITSPVCSPPLLQVPALGYIIQNSDGTLSGQHAATWEGILHPKDSGVIPGCAACLVLFYLSGGGFPCCGVVAVLVSSLQISRVCGCHLGLVSCLGYSVLCWMSWKWQQERRLRGKKLRDHYKLL